MRMLVVTDWSRIKAVLLCPYTCSLVETTRRRNTILSSSFFSMQLFFVISLLLALLAGQVCHGYNMQSYRAGGLWIPGGGGGGASSVDNNNRDDLYQQPQRPTISSSLSSRSSVSMTTQRETIRMPSQKPMVPYKPAGSDYAQFIDIEAAMYRDRTIMINKFIDEAAANQLISIMLYLRDENPREKISMYFNVPGGQVRPSLAIYDLMENTKRLCEIETVNLALCAGFSSLLCGAGTKGKRHAFPNARFLLQRVGIDRVFRGQATDIALEVRNVKAANDRMEKELATLTGQPADKIATDLQRDMYLVADEAVQYGLIDSVLLPSPRKRAARGGPTDLGTFEGEVDQRYQGDNDKGKPRFNKGGRPQPSSSPPPPGKGSKNNDDDEPKTFKG